MENITSIKTKTTKGLPGEATSTVETTLMDTEEGHGGQALATEIIETVGVTAEASKLAGVTTTVKSSRDPEGSSCSTSPPGEAAIQQMVSEANRLNLNTKRLPGAQRRKSAIAAGLPIRPKKSKSGHKLQKADSSGEGSPKGNIKAPEN
jgi:hypothetical protein